MKLSLPVCRKALRDHLRPLLASLDFVSKGKSPFTRPNPLGFDILRFPDRRDHDRCYFNVNLGISIQSIEEIMRPESKDLLSTIWTPIHFLYDDREFSEWVMRSEDDAPETAAAIMAAIRSYALPFFEQHTDLKNVANMLESASPRDWLGLGPGQRVSVLSALEFSRGNTDRAFEILENAIAAESEKPIPRNRPMKELLASLRARKV